MESEDKAFIFDMFLGLMKENRKLFLQKYFQFGLLPPSQEIMPQPEGTKFFGGEKGRFFVFSV